MQQIYTHLFLRHNNDSGLWLIMLLPDIQNYFIALVDPFRFPFMLSEVVHFVMWVQNYDRMYKWNIYKEGDLLIAMQYMIESSIFE